MGPVGDFLEFWDPLFFLEGVKLPLQESAGELY